MAQKWLSQFLLKSGVFQNKPNNSPNVWATFKEHLLPRTLKNCPIWSHWWQPGNVSVTEIYRLSVPCPVCCPSRWKFFPAFNWTASTFCFYYYYFLNMGQSRPLFVYFHSFLIPITISIIQIEKSIDGVLGIRTWGRMMVGEDETTELWRHPLFLLFLLS